MYSLFLTTLTLKRIMNISNVLNATISILDTFDHLTPTALDDEALKFLKVVRDSPLLIAYLEDKLSGVSIGTPDVADDAGSGNPFGRFTSELRNRPPREDLGERFAGLGEIIKLLPELVKYLPIIMELIKALRDNGILKPKAA